MIRRKVRRFIGKGVGGGRKLLWRLQHGTASHTTPVFIVGSQRSGTGMLGEVLGKSPEIENLGEHDPRAFDEYSIRDDATIQGLVRKCKHRFIVLKPLKDSERILHFLSQYPSGMAIWAYRSYADRINSAVKEFGRHPLEVFDGFSKGHRDAWQLRALDPEVERVVKSTKVADMSAYDGAALMWWVRSSLYFSLKLESEHRVRLWSYDRFVRNPKEELASLLEFLGARSFSYMLSDVHAGSYRKEAEPPLRAEIKELCELLYQRLEAASARPPTQQAQDQIS